MDVTYSLRDTFKGKTDFWLVVGHDRFARVTQHPWNEPLILTLEELLSREPTLVEKRAPAVWYPSLNSGIFRGRGFVITPGTYVYPAITNAYTRELFRNEPLRVHSWSDPSVTLEVPTGHGEVELVILPIGFLGEVIVNPHPECIESRVPLRAGLSVSDRRGVLFVISRICECQYRHCIVQNARGFAMRYASELVRRMEPTTAVLNANGYALVYIDPERTIPLYVLRSCFPVF